MAGGPDVPSRQPGAGAAPLGGPIPRHHSIYCNIQYITEQPHPTMTGLNKRDGIRAEQVSDLASEGRSTERGDTNVFDM